MAKREYDYLLKILLIGDSGTGKTGLLRSFVGPVHGATFISNIGKINKGKSGVTRR